MSCIIFSSVSFHYDSPYYQVLEDVNLRIDLNWRTGLIGRNGCGKTTLLKLLTGSLLPTKGNVVKNCTFYYFPYNNIRANLKTLDLIKDSIAPFRKLELEMETSLKSGDEDSLVIYSELLEHYKDQGGYEIEGRIEKEFKLLGMNTDLLSREFYTLSSGEQTRSLILSLFLKKNFFPLIDEPTNHLDMKGRIILADYLSNKRGFILVSHDRYFLDLCIDHVISLNKSDITVNKGNYSSWKENFDLQEEYEKREKKNLEKEVKTLLRAERKRKLWAYKKEDEKCTHADKGFIGHRAAKLMKRAISIEKRKEDKIDKMNSLLENFQKQRNLKLNIEKKSPDILVNISNININVGGVPVIKNLSLKIIKGDRIAIVGNNGSGKTTLIKAICGDIDIDTGIIYKPKFLNIERAHQIPKWNNGMLKLYLKEEELDEIKFYQIMGVLGVTGEIFKRPLETFSEGERKKVDLCRSFMGSNHLFIWDEPLNYLDIFSREQLEAVIIDFKPSILFVEHDKYFIENIATKIIYL